MKPRIALVQRIWECRLPDWRQTRVIGFGFNPADAYEEWKCQKRAAALSAAQTLRKRSMRQINDHKINPANDVIEITVTDQPGAGGANHRYEISGFDTATNASNGDAQGYRTSCSRQVILFQNGTIPENGTNGVTHEVLLAIVADRLRSFQAGPFACKANACALTHIEEAQHWLQQRTIERMRRGVEGTHTV